MHGQLRPPGSRVSLGLAGAVQSVLSLCAPGLAARGGCETSLPAGLPYLGRQGAVWTLTCQLVSPLRLLKGPQVGRYEAQEVPGGAGGREVRSSVCLESVDTDGDRKMGMG